MTAKKRGRPFSKATLEKQRIEKIMRTIPSHLPKLTDEELAELEEGFKHNEKIRLEILKTYKYGSWTPDEHAYNMASLGDESFEGYEQKVLDDDARYSQQAKKSGMMLAVQTSEKRNRGKTKSWKSTKL